MIDDDYDDIVETSTDVPEAIIAILTSVIQNGSALMALGQFHARYGDPKVIGIDHIGPRVGADIAFVLDHLEIELPDYTKLHMDSTGSNMLFSFQGTPVH